MNERPVEKGGKKGTVGSHRSTKGPLIGRSRVASQWPPLTGADCACVRVCVCVSVCVSVCGNAAPPTTHTHTHFTGFLLLLFTGFCVAPPWEPPRGRRLRWWSIDEEKKLFHNFRKWREWMRMNERERERDPLRPIFFSLLFKIAITFPFIMNNLEAEEKSFKYGGRKTVVGQQIYRLSS